MSEQEREQAVQRIADAAPNYERDAVLYGAAAGFDAGADWQREQDQAEQAGLLAQVERIEQRMVDIAELATMKDRLYEKGKADQAALLRKAATALEVAKQELMAAGSGRECPACFSVWATIQGHEADCDLLAATGEIDGVLTELKQAIGQWWDQ